MLSKVLADARRSLVLLLSPVRVETFLMIGSVESSGTSLLRISGSVEAISSGSLVSRDELRVCDSRPLDAVDRLRLDPTDFEADGLRDSIVTNAGRGTVNEPFLSLLIPGGID